MKDCEKLFLYLYYRVLDRGKNNINKKSKPIFKYQQYHIDLRTPWQIISIAEALEKYADISFDEITKHSQTADIGEMFPVYKIAKIATKKGYKVTANNSWEEIFSQIFLNEAEPHLGTHGKPTFIYDYPIPLAALAKFSFDDIRFQFCHVYRL